MENEGGRGHTCICVYSASSRVTAAQLDLVLMEERGAKSCKVPVCVRVSKRA